MKYQHVDAYAAVFGVQKVGKVLSDFAPSLDVISSQSKLAALRPALQRSLLMGTLQSVP